MTGEMNSQIQTYARGVCFMDFFNEDDLKEINEQLKENAVDGEEVIEETEEMKAARKRYENYILKNKKD